MELVSKPRLFVVSGTLYIVDFLVLLLLPTNVSLYVWATATPTSYFTMLLLLLTIGIISMLMLFYVLCLVSRNSWRYWWLCLRFINHLWHCCYCGKQLWCMYLCSLF